jgi:hypothetical protein
VRARETTEDKVRRSARRLPERYIDEVSDSDGVECRESDSEEEAEKSETSRCRSESEDGSEKSGSLVRRHPLYAKRDRKRHEVYGEMPIG